MSHAVAETVGWKGERAVGQRCQSRPLINLTLAAGVKMKLRLVSVPEMEQRRCPPRRHVSRRDPGAGKSLQLMCSLVAREVSLLVPDDSVKSSWAAARVSRSAGKVESPSSAGFPPLLPPKKVWLGKGAP